MKSLRRFIIPNATYFLTLVTHLREPLLLHDPNLFWESWDTDGLLAWVLLPDHLHLIVAPGTDSVSDVMHRFKTRYSRRYRDRYRSGSVWQSRFWDHVIRDESDMNRHLDYIHYNPVHHGIVTDPFVYSHSSLRKWHESGHYTRDWGVKESVSFDGEFGD